MKKISVLILSLGILASNQVYANESFINDMLSAQSYIDKINDIEKVVFNTIKWI